MGDRPSRLIAVLSCLSLLAFASPSMAQDDEDYGPSAEDWELTLSGSGTNDKDFDNGSVGASFNLGYFITDRSEIVLRQSVNYFDDEREGSSTIASSRFAFDYHLGDGRFYPFIGFNFGGVYGSAVEETFAAAPEAGFKWYVKPEAFVMMMGEYQFFFKDVDSADEQFDDGQFVYTVGLGINW